MSLFGQLLKIFDRSPSSRRPTAKRSSVRLDIESLEDRLVASASSSSVHAITPATGPSVAYFLNPNPIDSGFDEKFNYNGSGFLRELALSGAVSDFSAGLTSSGTAVVFAHYHGVLKYFSDATGWQDTKAPISMLNFAAVDGGRLYATGSNHALWEYTIPYQESVRTVNPRTLQVSWVTTTVGGWTELTAANTVVALDAVTQPSRLVNAGTQPAGLDFVFVARFATGNLEVYSQGTWTYIAAGGDQLNYLFSAGLDSQGKAELWFQQYFYDAGIYSFGSWTAAAGYSAYLQGSGDPDGIFVGITLSATGDGQCYFFWPAASALVLFDLQYQDGLFVIKFPPVNNGNVQLSAAGPGDVYYIFNGYLAEFTNGNLLTWQL